VNAAVCPALAPTPRQGKVQVGPLPINAALRKSKLLSAMLSPLFRVSSPTLLVLLGGSS
jgi:hypothetical protein